MTSRFELWNNLHRAMTPLAHWYAIIDNQVILELQNKVIHKVLYNRYCLIKWAPMHEQVTLLRKLLSHIFEHYVDVQDGGYISDEDIEEDFYAKTTHNAYQNTGTCATATTILHTMHLTTILNRDLNKTSTVSGEYCSHQKLNQKMNQCHWTTSTLRMKMCTSQMTLQIGSMNHHRTGTCAFMMNTRTDANILEHHPIRIP